LLSVDSFLSRPIDSAPYITTVPMLRAIRAAAD
jgi:hypothetical protein